MLRKTLLTTKKFVHFFFLEKNSDEKKFNKITEFFSKLRMKNKYIKSFTLPCIDVASLGSASRLTLLCVCV